MSRTNFSILLLASLALLSGGCSRKADPTATPVFVNEEDYNGALTKAEELSAKILQNYELGGTLQPGDVDKLRESRRLIRGAVAYMPQEFAPHVLDGRICLALGDYPSAKIALEQGLFYFPSPIVNPDAKRLYAETCHFLGETCLFMKDQAGAEKAAEAGLKQLPGNPELLTMKASAQIQQKKYKEAQASIALALKSDPVNERALALQKLLKMEGHG